MICTHKKKPKKIFRIGLLGNPNVGKSSIINKIIKQEKLKTGNWAGVTVAKKTIRAKNNNTIYDFTDLPGVFSFVCPNKVEEVTINEILSSKYDLFVQVLDGTNLQNSLYLTLLLKELNIDFVMLINFSDRLRSKSINVEQLKLILKKQIILTNIFNKNISKEFFCLIEDHIKINSGKIKKHESRCIPQIEWKKRFEKYRDLIKTEKKSRSKKTLNFYWYNEGINQKYNVINQIIKNSHLGKLVTNTHNQLLVQGILDNNHFIIKKFNLQAELIVKISTAVKQSRRMKNNYKHLKNERDKYISAIFNKCIIKQPVKDNWLNRYSWIDKILLNKLLAIPVLMAILFCLFVIIFNFTTPYKNFISGIFTYYLPGALHLTNNSHWYANLLTNGIFNALGTMLSFLPVMYLLFVILHVIEQSGVIARVSFMLDGLFKKFGMSGKSIIPLILGFGCNVGSIYATRTISNQQEKKITAMISPFISCSARLVVFALFTSIFFNTFGGLVIFSLYILGIVVAFSLAIIFMFFNRLTANKSETNLDDQLYDLPKYKIPNASLIFRLTNYSVRNYTKRVLKIILFFTLFVWLVNYVKIRGEHSILYYFSYVLKPIFTPLGFGKSWILCVALIPGIIAKETTVATLGLLFGVGVVGANAAVHSAPTFHEFINDFLLTVKNSFASLLPNHWFNSQNYGLVKNNMLSNKINAMLRASYKTTNIKLVAYSYMCFILLTIPCITTLGAIKQEYGYKTMIQSTVLGIITPYIITLLIFQSVNTILMH